MYVGGRVLVGWANTGHCCRFKAHFMGKAGVSFLTGNRPTLHTPEAAASSVATPMSANARMKRR